MERRLTPGVNDLETWCKQNNREELLSQWHPTKNGELVPSAVLAGTGQKAWWYLSYDVPSDYKVEHLRGKHFDFEWEASVANRSKGGAGCPFLTNNLVWTGFNDLVSVAPQIASQWDYSKNNEIDPKRITVYSRAKVWWVGECKHEWQATINRRFNGSKCPYCSRSRAMIGLNDFASKHPKLLREWDYERNIIAPSEVTAGSKKKIWWKCSKEHSWQASISNRVAKEATNCPYCSGRKIFKGFNDFESFCKQNNKEYLLDEWDYKLNTISPQDITAKSGKKIHWVCFNGHKWVASALDRNYGHGCPKCRLKGTSFPEQAIYYYIHKYFSDAVNGDRNQLDGTELDIYIPSLRTAIEYDGQKWHKDKKDLDDAKNKLCAEKNIFLIRVKENGESQGVLSENLQIYTHNCGDNNELSKVIRTILISLNIPSPEVDVNRDNVLIMNSYKFEYKEKSLAATNPEVILEWNYELNEHLTPEMFTPKSNAKIWFTCKKGHNYKQAINHKTEGKGCPYCAGVEVLPGFNDVATVYPEILNEWDYDENTILPRNITFGSGKKIHWICSKGHKWVDSVGHRTSMKLGCPYCSNKRVLKGYNDLATTNPSLLEEWDYEANVSITPDVVTKSSRKKAHWICSQGHKWEAVINSRNQGTGCPYCANNLPTKVQCVETKQIYASLGMAARSTSASLAGIHKCLKTGKGTSGGLHWRYIE